VGEQHCCNQVNKVNPSEVITSRGSLLICRFSPTTRTLSSAVFLPSWV
jgi:hypothetical protein